MLTENDIRNALRACYDTANVYRRPVNIVDLGLVEQIVLSVDAEAPGAGIAGVPVRHRLALTLVASSDDEDAQAMLAAQIANRMAGLPEISKTAIRFSDSVAWTEARITPEGWHLLRLNSAAFPILNNRVR